MCGVSRGAGARRAVFAGQSQLVQREIYLVGQHVATYANGTAYFGHANRLGTERARTNLSGGTVEADSSPPYGGWLNQVGTISALHFVGQPFDGESALSYLSARLRSGFLGRFLTPDDGSAQDPADPQSWDLYTYARDNPVTLADPSGRYWCKAGEPPRSPNCVSDKEFAKKTKAQQVGWVHVSNDITVTVRASAAPPVRAIDAPDPFYQIAAAVTAYNPGGFIRDFEVLSITTALTGPLAGVLGEGAEAGTAAEADAAAGTAAEVADVASVVARATAATGNETITVASREVAEEAADQFLGPESRVLYDRNTGAVAGRASADGTRVVLGPHTDSLGEHLNFRSRLTGADLHVRW